MENFIVSARKYRPATFDTVVGQASITRTLKNAIRNNQIAQAFLFCGPRGVGKTTCARILAKTINCQNLTDNIEPCNECESCRSFNSSASFNIHELDAASNNSVDDIRNLVDQVRIPPQAGKYKVYIIDEVHMLSASAFNAFLKTLEEPPAYAKFILATTEKHKILPTILSRCQVFDFKRITVEDIASHLRYVADQEEVQASGDALHLIAQKADGALRDALSIFDQLVSFTGKNLSYEVVIQNLNILDYDYYFRITGHILDGDISNTLLLINEIISNGFDGQHFLTGMGEHLRNLLVSKDPATLQLLEVSPGLKDKYQAQSVRCDAGFLLKALDINNQCDITYKASNNKNLHLELALLRMCSLSGLKEQSPPPEKKNVTPSPPPPAKEKESIPPVTTRPPEPVKNADENDVPKNTGGKTLPGTVSIKRSRHKQDEVPGQINGDDDLSNKPVKPFTQDDLIRVWGYYHETLKNDSPSLYSTLTKDLPVLKEDFIIELKVFNKVLEKEINDRRMDMLAYLRKELENYSISMEILVDEDIQESKAYFPEEIFQKLSEKNPALRELKDKLDLELDF
ncbi:MAG: DNA polymerase III subunit gamma/tau [Bacteroidetes bacterium]|nr:DNA polymerase III subunit gamma/tau [Bacteroidota bacterium]